MTGECPALTHCPPHDYPSRDLMGLTFQDFTVQMMFLNHCTLPRCSVSAPLSCYRLLHLFLPLPKPNRAQSKTSCKKWPLPAFSPVSFSLRAGLQELKFIKIRRHKPPAHSRSVSQSCQAGGCCQGRGGDLVCGQADAPWEHSPDDCSPFPQWLLTVSLQHKQPCPSPAPPVSSSTKNIIWDTTVQKCLEKDPPEIPIPCCWGPCTRGMAGTQFSMPASQTAFPSVSHQLCFA